MKEANRKLIPKLSDRLDDMLKNTAFSIALEQEVSMMLNKSNDDCANMEYMIDFFESNVPIEIKNELYKEISIELEKITLSDDMLNEILNLKTKL